MGDWSRRRALRAVGSAAVATLAGCSGEGSGFEEPPSSDRGDPVEDYEVRIVRDDRGGELFWEGDLETASGESTQERVRGGTDYVQTGDDADALSFAADSDAAASLASFVRDTDFDSGSVLVAEREISACRELVFRGVWRTESSLHTEYCLRVRPADEACGVDEVATVGVGVRLPFSMDLTSLGASLSGDCDPLPVGSGWDEHTVDNGGGGA